MVDEDTNAFNKIMQAYRLPKSSKEDEKNRDKAIQEATKYAILTPFKVMGIVRIYASNESYGRNWKSNSVTDAGVGALCARTAVLVLF